MKSTKFRVLWMLPVLSLLFILPFQSCDIPGSQSSKSELELNGNGQPYGGMRGLTFASVRHYDPLSTTPANGASYFRNRQGNTCNLDGETSLSPAGEMRYQNGSWHESKNICSEFSAVSGEVLYQPYNERIVVYQDRIYEREDKPFLQPWPSENLVYCSNFESGADALDLVLTRNHRYPESPVGKTRDINFYTEILGEGTVFNRDDGGASVASYFDESGHLRYSLPGEPRFNYDPLTGEFLGLLIEGESTNYLTESDVLNRNWSGARIEDDSVLAPDRNETADRVQIPGDSVITLQRILANRAQDGEMWTMSIFFSTQELPQGSSLSISTSFTGGTEPVRGEASFEVSSDQERIGGEAVSVSLKKLRNHWNRLSVTVENNSAQNRDLLLEILVKNSSLTAGHLALWGAQLERKSIPTSYISTGVEPRTRSAENVEIIIGDWFNPEAGTFLVEWQLESLNSGVDQHILVSELRSLKVEKEQDERFHVAVKGHHVIPVERVEAGRFYRSAFTYSPKLLEAYQDGGDPAQKSMSGLPDFGSKFHLGRDQLYGEYLHGHIKRVSYWPMPLHEGELVDITHAQTFVSPYSAFIVRGSAGKQPEDFVAQESTVFSLQRRDEQKELRFGSNVYNFEMRFFDPLSMSKSGYSGAHLRTEIEGHPLEVYLNCLTDL